MPIVLFLETSSQFLRMSDCRLKQQHLQELLLFVQCVQELLVGSHNFAARWSALHLLPLQEFRSRQPRAKCESHKYACDGSLRVSESRTRPRILTGGHCIKRRRWFHCTRGMSQSATARNTLIGWSVIGVLTLTRILGSYPGESD